MTREEWMRLKAGDLLVTTGMATHSRPFCDGQLIEVLEVAESNVKLKHPDAPNIWSTRYEYYRKIEPMNLDWRVR